MSTTADKDPLTVLTSAFWSGAPLPGSTGGGVDAEGIARTALFALQDAGLVVAPPTENAVTFEQVGSFMMRLFDSVPTDAARQAVLAAAVEEFSLRTPRSKFSD